MRRRASAERTHIARSACAARSPPSHPAFADSPAPTLAAVRASLALRSLTDFALVYGAAAGQILKRDAERGLLRHILRVQLPADGGEASESGAGESAKAGWDGGERAAHALLAMCVRSAEARRRILAAVPPRLRGFARADARRGSRVARASLAD